MECLEDQSVESSIEIDHQAMLCCLDRVGRGSLEAEEIVGGMTGRSPGAVESLMPMRRIFMSSLSSKFRAKVNSSFRATRRNSSTEIGIRTIMRQTTRTVKIEGLSKNGIYEHAKQSC